MWYIHRMGTVGKMHARDLAQSRGVRKTHFLLLGLRQDMDWA